MLKNSDLTGCTSKKLNNKKQSTFICAILIFMLMVVSFILLLPSPVQHLKTTYSDIINNDTLKSVKCRDNTDIHINNSRKVNITDDLTYRQTGSIFVRDNGTLDISNAAVSFIQQYDEQFKIDVSGRGVLKIRNGFIRGENNRMLTLNLSDDAQLIAENSTLYMNINISGNATVIINNCNVINTGNHFRDWAGLFASNSSFNNSLIFSDNATGIIANTTAAAINVSNDSVVAIHQWLTVNVRDSNNMPVQSANVTVRYYLNDTVAATLQTDELGRAIIEIHTNTTTSEKDSFVGNYKIVVNYSSVEVQHAVSITSSQSITTPLSVSPDISVKEISLAAAPVLNETNYINITVENIGVTASPRTLVRTFADYFMNETFIDPILPGSTKNISLSWMPKLQGYNTITVRLDPANSVNETDKANNNKSSVVWANGRGGPVVGVDAIAISNQNPTEDENVWFNITLYNVGETNATNLSMEFYINETLFSNTSIRLFLSNSTQIRCIVWKATVSYNIGLGWKGSHEITVKIGESNKSSWLWVRTKPDFTFWARDINVSNTSPLEGSTVWMNATLQNIGETNATNVLVRFYIDDSSISENIVPMVIADSWYTVSASWNATPNGTRTITARADPEYSTHEGDETNNNASITIYVRKIADLKPIGIILPSNFTVGDALNITAEIRNQGENDADIIIVRFYDGNNTIGDTSIIGLSSNTSKNVSVVWNVDSVGEHTISVITDPDNHVKEDNETNNVLQQNITIKSRPDLTISNITVNPAYPFEGESAEISIVVSNIGGTDTEATADVYLNTINPQSKVGSANASAPSNSEAVCKITWRADNITGVSRLYAVVTSSIRETNTANNAARKDIIVYSRQGDINVGDGEVKNINSDYVHTGSILVTNNGTLSIANSELKLVQVRDYQYGIIIDNAILYLNKSTIKSNHQFVIYLYNNSHIILDRSTISANCIVSVGNTTLLVKNSNIESNIAGTLNAINIIENSKMTGDIFINLTTLEVSNSNINGALNITSGTISLTNSKVFGAINFESSSLTLTNVVTDSSSVRLSSSSMFINDSAIKTSKLKLYGANITTANSTYTQPLEFINSTVSVINVTTPSISISGDSALYKYWWLTVIVRDYADTPVPNANITIRSLNSDYTVNATTDNSGSAIAQILTNTTLKEEHFVGNYEVNISYSNEMNLQYKIRSEYNTVLNAKFNEILIPPTGIQLTVVLDKASSLPDSRITVSGDAAYSNNIKAPNANITIRIIETGTIWQDKTDSNGHYEVSIVAPNKTGTYTISVEITDPLWGFPLTMSNQTLSVEQQKEATIQEKKQMSLLQIMLIVIAITIGIAAGLVFFFIYLKRLKHVAECSQCGLVLPHHQRRCPNCETEFDDALAKCSECNEVIEMKSKECPKCGAKFSHDEK